MSSENTAFLPLLVFLPFFIVLMFFWLPRTPPSPEQRRRTIVVGSFAAVLAVGLLVFSFSRLMTPGVAVAAQVAAPPLQATMQTAPAPQQAPVQPR